MFNFLSLKRVSKDTDKQGQLRNQSAEESYEQAIAFIHKFNFEKNYNSKYLLEAAMLLSKAVKFKKTNPEPYFLLSYIFYLMNKDDLSIKYLKIAEKIQPDMPGISKMQQLLRNTNRTFSPEKVNTVNNNEGLIYEFNGEIKTINSLKNVLGEVRFKKKGTGNLEYNCETKSVTTLGKKIQRVTRLSQT